MIYYKNSSELYHHGVTGQKWGRRHGPPYPLDDDGKVQATRKRKAIRSAKKESEKKVESEGDMKKRLLERPDAEEIYKNKEMFTTQELQSMYSRLVVEKNLETFALQQKTKDSTYRNIMKELEQANKDIDTMDKTITRLVGGKKNREKLDQEMTQFLGDAIYSIAVTGK